MKIYILSYIVEHRLCRLNYQKIRIKILSKHFIQHSLLILCYCGNMQERLISAGVNFCSLTTKDSIFLSLLAYRSASNLAIASWHNPEMKNCIFKCISFNYQLSLLNRFKYQLYTNEILAYLEAPRHLLL